MPPIIAQLRNALGLQAGALQDARRTGLYTYAGVLFAGMAALEDAIAALSPPPPPADEAPADEQQPPPAPPAEAPPIEG
jgi:hypothetical protein